MKTELEKLTKEDKAYASVVIPLLVSFTTYLLIGIPLGPLL
jgi:hypothetical protein